jgi:hypothetical protein
MGKNQSASNLTNIIKQDANGGIAFMSGSTMLMSLSNTGQMSGSVPVLSASTASFVALAQSASNAVSAQTASFANTFTVASTLTAQTLVVQTITSSVDFVTGSTRFGSLIGNTHVFTGSVNITGSNTIVGDLTLNGNRNIFLSNTNPAAGAIRFFNAASGSTKSAIGSYFNVADEGNLEFLTGGSTTRMVINSSGNVGIGTTSPLVRFQITQPNGIGTPTLGTSTGGLFIAGDGNQYGLYIGNDGNTGNSWLQAMRNNTATAYNILLNPVGGNVGIGTISPTFLLDLQRSSAGADVALRIQNTAASGVNDASALHLGWSSTLTGYSSIITDRGGRAGSSSAQGSLYFNANQDTTERIRMIIRGDTGNVGIGTTGPSHRLTVAGNVGMSRFYSTVAFSSYTPDGLFNAASLYCAVTPPGGGELRFGYLDYGSGQYWGRIGFVAPTNWSLGTIGGAGNDFSIGTNYNGSQLYIYANGNYAFSGSNVSDRRKKANINYITSNQLDNILKLKPATFNKIADEVVNENVHTGFIAQDIIEEGIPNLVMGSDEGGYGLDYDGILALTVKAIQELKAENDTLKEILQRNNIQ